MAYSQRATKSRTPAKVPDFVSEATATQNLNDAINIPGTMRNVRSIGHILSPSNMAMVSMQCRILGIEPGLSGTFKEWGDVGRRVKRKEDGGSAMYVLAPTMKHVDVEQPDGSTKKELRIIGFHEIKSRFVYSQTTGPDKPLPEIPFDYGELVTRLQVEMVGFEMDNMQCGGYCYGDEVGDYLTINPMWDDGLPVLFHELAHIVLGHTAENVKMVTGADRTPRNVRELEAEGVTLLLLDLLDLPGQDICRGYMQNWNIDGLTEIPESVAKRIFAAAYIIYRAGSADSREFKIRMLDK